MRPYTRIEIIERELNVSRITASKYLNLMAQMNIIEKRKLGRGVYFINQVLFEIISHAGDNT